MAAPVFRESAFVWACVGLVGGCALAALAAWQRKFLLGLSEGFVRLPPSGKAVLVTAVVVATVFAQKPGNVSTDSHGLTRIEGEKPTALNTCAEETQSVSEGRSKSDSERSELPARAREETEGERHGEGNEVLDRIDGDGTDSSNPVNPVKESPCLSNSVTSALSESNLPALSSNDVVRGYRLETVRTNTAVSYARPANARLVGTWHLTDAYRGRVKVELPRSPHFSTFPLFRPSTSCWAHTWGKVRPQLRNASNEIVVIGSPMFARHDQSFLWTAATTNGSVVLTWENFFLGNPYEGGKVPSGEVPGGEGVGLSSTHRSTFPPFHFSTVSAQLELRGNGDFIARSNGIERVYRRVNPDDWDDDGIPNDADDAPIVAADELQFGPHQTLPEDANTNAYCWIDLVVRHANAKVTFAGDGESDLADPSFIAEADATNRVTLLIGKTYRVTCPMPFEVAGKSSDDIEESWEEDGAALWLHWPVAIRSQSSESRARAKWLSTNLHESTRISIRENSCQFVANQTTDGLPPGLLTSFLQTYAAGSSRPFTMQVTPFGLGGAFTWTNICCRVSGSGCTFTVTCGDGCSCGGCSATGYLEYEGYRLPAYGGFCGCGGSVDHPGDDQDPEEDPPLPGASATFSKRVIFFEDEYENAPGETVPWQSTETRLDCWAYGGTRGGHVRIEIAGADGLVPYGGLPLPFEQDLEPGEEVAFKTTYRAARPSGSEGDIVVTATFTENETGWTATTVDKATGVKVELTPEKTVNDCMNRHRWGVCERVWCAITPFVDCVQMQACEGAWFDSLQGGSAKCLVCPEVESSGLLMLTGGGASDAMGANEWHLIGIDNFFFVDAAKMMDALILPCRKGLLAWHIPILWQSAGETGDVTHELESVDQRFEMSESGTLRVSKFGFWVERALDGTLNRSEGVGL